MAGCVSLGAQMFVAVAQDVRCDGTVVRHWGSASGTHVECLVVPSVDGSAMLCSSGEAESPSSCTFFRS